MMMIDHTNGPVLFVPLFFFFTSSLFSLFFFFDIIRGLCIEYHTLLLDYNYLSQPQTP